jgi:dolichol-phosphate mannosyltransferase
MNAEAEKECTGDEAPVTLSVVVPLYNEEENVLALHRRLSLTLGDIGIEYELVFVNDGSTDRTESVLDTLQEQDPHLVVLQLSRNFGHQAAVSAGIDSALGEAVLVMDGDLQDPPEAIPQFVRLWREGHDVVYAIRQKRKEGWFKRLGYFVFYRMLGAIGDFDIPLDSGDFCLMSRRVVSALIDLPERKRFVRGLRTFVGFRQVGLPYERPAREQGRPKYYLRHLIGLAIDGLVSFSSYPLRMVTYFGLVIAFLGIALLFWVLFDAVSGHTAPRGWASTMVIVLVIGSIQLISLGIIGEYIRLIFWEAKQRPTYIVGEFKAKRRRTSRADSAPTRGSNHSATPASEEASG